MTDHLWWKTGSQSVAAFEVAGSGRILVSTELDREGPVALEDLELPPHEGVIVKLD